MSLKDILKSVGFQYIIKDGEEVKYTGPNRKKRRETDAAYKKEVKRKKGPAKAKPKNGHRDKHKHRKEQKRRRKQSWRG